LPVVLQRLADGIAPVDTVSTDEDPSVVVPVTTVD
jgi:hypothetical protein